VSLTQDTTYEYLRYLRDTESIPEDVKTKIDALCAFLSIAVDSQDRALMDSAYTVLQRDLIKYVSDNHPEIFSKFYESLSASRVQAVLAEAQ
jgi:hypothetical protein